MARLAKHGFETAADAAMVVQVGGGFGARMHT
jgi:hypothetical protein